MRAATLIEHARVFLQGLVFEGEATALPRYIIHVRTASLPSAAAKGATERATLPAPSLPRR